jgi:hypothetical protein
MLIKHLLINLDIPLVGEHHIMVTKILRFYLKKMNNFWILGGSLLRVLHEVATTILPDSACEARYSPGMVTTATQVCSGENNKGACQVKKST